MKLNVNDVVIVNPWKNFHGMRMTCTNVYTDAVIGMPVYEFDNGMMLFDIELENNFDLWSRRGGYRIERA